MNTVVPPEHSRAALVDIIDFKWLMGHEGHAVHVERLQQDAAYADRCLLLAEKSPTEALRRVTARLRLGLPVSA